VKRFIAKRLLETILVLFMALTAVFFMIRLAGDPTLLMVPLDASPQYVEQFRHEMGFDEPMVFQYGRFVLQVLTGDFGTSIRQRVSVLSLVLERIPASLLLTTTSICTALILAIPLGVLSAIKRDSAVDRFSLVCAVFAQSIPIFWLGLMLILMFSVLLQWFPTGGMGSLRHLVLPTITLGAYSAARIMRITRSSMIEVLQMDYVQTARAKGLKERVVIWKHALKNASLPVITMTGLQIGVVFGGAVITETIFSWPGLGRLIVQSISFRDYPTVQASVFVTAVMFCLINLIVDILYAVVNPEIKLEKSAE
jgi:peptide/nickel transport system permease protein